MSRETRIYGYLLMALLLTMTVLGVLTLVAGHDYFAWVGDR